MSSDNWAPERLLLQRGVGEEGSHTWCEDSITEDSIGDPIERAEYVRTDCVTVSVPVTDETLVALFYAAQGDITKFRIKAREILGERS
jgi:hypothetical protein